MKIFSILLLIVTSSIFLSCEKFEGQGGAATIKGSVLGKKYNAIGVLISEYPKHQHDMYIIYGESTTYYDDKIETSYDGTFEFRNLQPGTYTIFTYSEDPTAPSGEVVITKTITISKGEKKQSIDAGVIEIRD